MNFYGYVEYWIIPTSLTNCFQITSSEHCTAPSQRL